MSHHIRHTTASADTCISAGLAFSRSAGVSQQAVAFSRPALLRLMGSCLPFCTSLLPNCQIFITFTFQTPPPRMSKCLAGTSTGLFRPHPSAARLPPQIRPLWCVLFQTGSHLALFPRQEQDWAVAPSRKLSGSLDHQLLNLPSTQPLCHPWGAPQSVLCVAALFPPKMLSMTTSFFPPKPSSPIV